MATVAEQLRHAREQQQLSVHQVAELTKIKSDHVRALEAGDYGCFTAPVYIRGFVRTYARFLKLDDQQLVADLEAELAQGEDGRRETVLSGPARGGLDSLMLWLSQVNWRFWLIVLGAGAVVVGAVVTYRHVQELRRTDPLQSLGPGLYQPRQQATGDVLPLPPGGSQP